LIPYEWLWGALVLSCVLLGLMGARLVNRNRRLQDASSELADSNAMQHEGAVESVRVQVQVMEEARDFEAVLAVLTEELVHVGLDNDSCEIEMLDEEPEEMSLAYFESKGFRFTTYTVNEDGSARATYHRVSPPLPEMVRASVKRVIAGEVWQTHDEGQAIVEVPIARYGLLRLKDSQRDVFTDGEINMLRDFGVAIALGFARYLDFCHMQEQTEHKTEFLSAISHEFRTPLTSIMGYVDNLSDGISGDVNDRQRHVLGRIRVNANNLLVLVNDLLDLAKIQAGHMEAHVGNFDVVELIEGCCATVRPLAKTGVDLRCEISEGVGKAHTDEARLRQIVINLLSNALKFTSDGYVSVRVNLVGTHLIVTVSDTGAGIPEEALSDIFEKFQQGPVSDTQTQGTGLGLPLTRGWVVLLGGSIDVRSKVGEGSTFTVRMPVMYEESE